MVGSVENLYKWLLIGMISTLNFRVKVFFYQEYCVLSFREWQTPKFSTLNVLTWESNSYTMGSLQTCAPNGFMSYLTDYCCAPLIKSEACCFRKFLYFYPYNNGEIFDQSECAKTCHWKISLQSRRNFGERVLSIFLTKMMASSLVLVAAQGWGEKELCTKKAVEGQK